MSDRNHGTEALADFKAAKDHEPTNLQELTEVLRAAILRKRLEDYPTASLDTAARLSILSANDSETLVYHLEGLRPVLEAWFEYIDNA